MVDPDPGYGFPRLHSTELSLWRAGKQGLHLAIFPQDQFQSPSDTRLKILTKHFPRFCTVNIHSDSSEIVFRVLTMLLQHGVPEKVSQLSLRYRDERPDTDRAHFVHNYFNKDQSFVLPRFARLMSSLSALRISNILFDWNNITFSTRLVELRVDEIRLAGTPLVELFMKALSSARELRDLKLIKIEAFSNQGSDILPGSHVPLPKLRSLYLEDLHLNVVNLFLASTTPHSYYLTLNLRTRTTTTLIGEFDTEDVTVDDICESLAPFPVNKLILEDDEPIWATRSGLHSLLKSMPSLKALILNFYNLDNELLRALEPPSTSRSSTNRDQFPKLETVEFHCVSLLDGGEELKRVVASHPIRNLVLGGSVRHDYDELPLEEDDDLVQWLKANVSGFRFLGDVEDAPESTDIGWQLWGL